MKIDILMDKDKSITACFRRKKYILTTAIDPVNGGTITGAGKYPINTIVPVKATPNTDYEFDHWSGDIPGKWSGLGMCYEDIFETENFDAHIDTLLANGFNHIRLHISCYQDPDEAKAQILAAVAKGADVTWGIGGAPITLTSTNWPDYRTAVLTAATWAQANGVYEFLIGNEEERHNDDTTLTDAQLRTNLRSLATEVQAIFTKGDVGYGNSTTYLSDWITEGRGDIDQLSWMVYMDEPWENNVDSIIANFGVDHTYINEWNVDSGGYSWYSEDEAVQAAGVTQMIDYFKASGITRADFFGFKDPYFITDFGVMKDDGTYRLLWSQALLNSGSVKFATVPTKTTTASLPGTIALIPRVTR